ncbi:3-oxoacyl-[acyl-carrier-protein] reductase FabG [Grifola frondosa]|uniref:3-oxoacyl-[acyl-carrier-protein] reductase FabG n=1 Tax=Grifola frondosa TaxID=5627 RepID=A0A1C7M5B8_GRIFR|nr:3-oxoacyl-[acyl-carrier-protein] reductase FabG [Grifola frondosa]
MSKGTAIVTGAAEGIGRAIAIRLAEDGYDIGLFDLPRSEQKLQAVAEHIQKETGRRTVNVLGDVSVEDDVKALVENVVRDLGGLDVVSTRTSLPALSRCNAAHRAFCCIDDCECWDRCSSSFT